MERFIINQLALAKAQLEVHLLEAQWRIKELEAMLKAYEEPKGSNENGERQDLRTG